MTYEEYFSLVQKELKPYLQVFQLTDSQILDFMRREESTIKNRYDYDMKEFEVGNITRKHLETRCTGGVAYCLSLMYE